MDNNYDDAFYDDYFDHFYEGDDDEDDFDEDDSDGYNAGDYILIAKTGPRCKDCGCLLDEDDDFMLEPYPHLTCPRCGEWYPLF